MDAQDRRILKILQENCKLSSKDIAKKITSKTSTVYAKIQRMEQEGIIKEYTAVLNPDKMHRGVASVLHISVDYRPGSKIVSQRAVTKKIAAFPEIQEVHIVSGQWDIIAKVRNGTVDEIGKFVVDKLRKIEGVGKVETAVIFSTEKESLKLDI